MGIALQFSGGAPIGGPVFPNVVPTYLSSPGSNDTINDWTTCAWVKRDANGTRNSIWGRVMASTNGWGHWFTDATPGEFVFWMNGTAVSSAGFPDCVGRWQFIAHTYKSSTGVSKFYHGLTPATVTLITTVTGVSGGFGELYAFYPVTIGWALFGYLQDSTDRGWNGGIDNWQSFYGELSLAQLQDAAACGCVDLTGIPIFHKWCLPLNGTDPEVATVLDTVSTNNFTLSGTAPGTIAPVVLSGTYVGCDAASTPPPDPPDLVVAKTVDNDTPLVGDNVTWTITVENVSLVDAAGSSLVVDMLPSQVLFISYTATQGTYNHSTGLWTIGSIAAATTVQLQIVTRVLEGGVPITNIATATLATTDPTPENNVASVSILGSVPPEEECPALPLPTTFQEDDSDTELSADICQDVV